jgi:hypothetical protein
MLGYPYLPVSGGGGGLVIFFYQGDSGIYAFLPGRGLCHFYFFLDKRGKSLFFTLVRGGSIFLFYLGERGIFLFLPRREGDIPFFT